MLFLAACDGRRPSSGRLDNDYSFTTGYVTDRGYSPGAGDYYVMTVGRTGEPPWLVVAEPYDRATSGFTTKSSTGSTDVMVDGTTYVPIPGKSIVAFQREGQLKQRVLDPSKNPTLPQLSTGLSDVSRSEFAALLPDGETTEQPHATEPAAGPDSNG